MDTFTESSVNVSMNVWYSELHWKIFIFLQFLLQVYYYSTSSYDENIENVRYFNSFALRLLVIKLNIGRYPLKEHVSLLKTGSQHVVVQDQPRRERDQSVHRNYIVLCNLLLNITHFNVLLK